jgi:hypothetical protein
MSRRYVLLPAVHDHTATATPARSRSSAAKRRTSSIGTTRRPSMKADFTRPASTISDAFDFEMLNSRPNSATLTNRGSIAAPFLWRIGAIASNTHMWYVSTITSSGGYMDLEVVRGTAASRFRRVIPDEIWDYFSRRDLLSECLTDGELDTDALDAEVQMLLDCFGDAVAPEQPRRTNDTDARNSVAEEPVQQDVELHPSEARRASAYSELVARTGAQMHSVKRVREQILGSSLLALPDAISLLQSPVARQFPRWLLEREGVPLVGHTATLVEQSPDDDGLQPILIQPGDVILKAATRHPPDYKTLEYPDAEGGIGVTSYVRFSVVDEIAQAARALESALPWTQVQAVGFLLCGMVPSIQPLRVSYRHTIGPIEHATVTIRVEPWVSAQTVEAAYRRVQKELLGRENRPLVGRGLDVLSFCLSRPDRSWEQLKVEWNSTNPDRQYPDRQNFWRDFERTKNHLGRPGYRTKRQRRRIAADSQTDSQPGGCNASDGY